MDSEKTVFNAETAKIGKVPSRSSGRRGRHTITSVMYELSCGFYFLNMFYNNLLLSPNTVFFTFDTFNIPLKTYYHSFS